MNHLKGYPDLEAAERSKAAGMPGAEAYACTVCPMVHVRKAKAAPKGQAPAARQRDTGPTRAVRSLVLDRDDTSCVSCGASVLNRPYSLQHRVARGMGGGRQPWISSPVNLCGVSLALLGFSNSGCVGGASTDVTVLPGSGNGNTVGSGNLGVGSGNTITAPVSLPVNVCGVSLAVLGFSNSECQGGASTCTDSQ